MILESKQWSFKDIVASLQKKYGEVGFIYFGSNLHQSSPIFIFLGA